MYSYLVRCRNAAGTIRDILVRSTSAAVATRRALEIVESDAPGQGWRAQWAI